MKSQQKTIDLFTYSSGIALLIAAFAKMISAGGNSRILQTLDPLLSISFREVFWIVGIIELAIALACLFGKRIGLKIGLIAWLSTNCVAYRLSLFQIGYHKPCSCLGNLTDSLHIPPQAADTAMKIILVYLLIGSYATLFWFWRQRNQAATTAAAP